ncbi:MAG: PQQ-binding-like beta-propeller repeat protein [Solirubrobacterales bacterium]|nr:PQQ-binding-like beta-propeller repeat protein [Solirubrobacterales bacterium]
MVLGSVFVLLVLAGSAAAFLLTRDDDVVDQDVVFRPEPTATATPEPTPAPRDRRGSEPPFTWAHYGYSKDRRRYLPAPSSLRPPFRRVWSLTGSVLLEFGPVIGGRSLYLLKNNGAVYAVSKRTGEVRWKRKLGYLAASSPAFGEGKVFVTLLKRDKRERAGRVAALSARTGRLLWSKPLASRSESSPLVDNGRVYFGSENGTVYALRASDGAVRWRYRAGGAVKSGLALADGKLYFGDYDGKLHAIRQADGRRVWRVGTSGARFGFSAGNFYSTPAVAYGRVYLGNTDGRIYSFASDNGKLAWAKRTGGYVYASPAVAQVPGGKPTVYAGSYDGRFYALDARTGRVRWSHNAKGKISGSATVVGEIVYFSNLGRKSTVGLGARTGRKVFNIRRGAFNPVVSDGNRIYLTGYSSLYAFKPR